jgi:hypothetical protein
VKQAAATIQRCHRRIAIPNTNISFLLFSRAHMLTYSGDTDLTFPVLVMT